MKISVLIPTFGNADTIVATVESALAQQRPPDEIIVLLDGVADDTPRRLDPFRGRISVLSQPNAGVARARNRLVVAAHGDVLAFLDADDVWHPDYLLAQESALRTLPDAVAAYCGHREFTEDPPPRPAAIEAGPVELLTPRTFFRRLNITSADFGSMSYCCVRRPVMTRLGADPFSCDLSGPEDCYLHYQLALQGPIAFQPAALVAYRLRHGSLSEDRARVLRDWTEVFARLEDQFRRSPDPWLRADFRRFYAQKRREYAQVLLGLGATGAARRELRRSLRSCFSPSSQAKSLALLGASYLPAAWQPRWPRAVRTLPPARKSATLSSPPVLSR